MRGNLLFLGSSFERYRVVASAHGLISSSTVRPANPHHALYIFVDFLIVAGVSMHSH